MKLAQAVGKRVKELLFKKNITQYRLCKTTCLSEKTIRDLIRNKTSDIKLSTIFLMLDVFEMSLTEFFDSPLFYKKDIEI